MHTLKNTHQTITALVVCLCIVFAGSSAVYAKPYSTSQTATEGARQEVVSGVVTDAQSGETLPGVNIVVEGTQTGTTTDAQGRYEIEVPSLEGRLIFSFVGYRTQEVPIEGQTEINVSLTPVAIEAEELVVVGYGEQQRASITGSVEQIDGAELADQPSLQASAALMGKVAGVQVEQTSGQPGANEGTIRVRGIGTLGNSNPLVLIDGIEGSLNDVASADIQSISVLKDASAAAIYGSRAANGVLLVETKRGTEDGINVSYRARAGLQQAADQPNFSDGGTYMRLHNEGSIGLGNDPVWSEEFIEEWVENHETSPDQYPDTDWVESVFSETAYQQSHNLNVSGGNETVRYMGSLSVEDEAGEIANFNFQRYSARLNTDVTASERLDFTFDVNVVREDQLEPTAGFGATLQDTYRVPPVFADRYSHGGWGPGWNLFNPLANIHDGGMDRDNAYNLRGKFGVDYNPIDLLTLSLVYAPTYNTSHSKEMRKQYAVTSPDDPTEIVGRSPSRNFLDESWSNTFQQNLNVTSELVSGFGDHTVTTLGGFEYIDSRNEFFGAFRDNFTLQDFEQLNAGATENMQNEGSASEWALTSFFGRLNYDYQGKYLLEANVRFDGSSRFAEGNKWGVFPSFSAGWLISDEPFMASIDVINRLRLKGSWGQLGNQQIGTYPFASTINLGQEFFFGGSPVPGAAQTDLANQGITWESTTTTNAGLDVGLFEDQLFFEFEYYQRETEDILLQLPVPLVIGLNAPFQNAGVVRNTGWELDAGFTDGIGEDFSYTVSFNVSDVDNEVMDLKDAGPFISGNSIVQEGDPINAIYGWESDGLFQSQEEVDSHAGQFGDVAPGDIRYVDQNDDGVINSDDRVVIGDPFSAMNYGVDISAGYKNFDLAVFIQGVGSRDVLLQGDAIWAFWNAGKIREWQANDYWTPDNPDASYPRVTPTTSHNNFRATDFWVYDASYMRLRNLQVGYTLPQPILDRLDVQRLRVFVVGQNLLTLFDDMPPGVDPNVPNGTFGSFYPVNRMYSAGIDISF